MDCMFITVVQVFTRYQINNGLIYDSDKFMDIHYCMIHLNINIVLLFQLNSIKMIQSI